MQVQELIDLLKLHAPSAVLRFSVADDASPDEGERWFCEDGIEDCFGNSSEVTICLVGKSNLTGDAGEGTVHQVFDFAEENPTCESCGKQSLQVEQS